MKRMGLLNSDDNQDLATIIQAVLPNLNIAWNAAMTAIDKANLDEYTDDPQQINNLRALLKLHFSLQEIAQAQINPQIQSAEFQGIVENLFLKLRYEIANVNPLLLFEFLHFVAQPNPKLNENTKVKIASFELLQRYGDYVVHKCNEKNIDANVIYVQEEKLKNNITDGIIAEGKYILQQEKYTIEIRQEGVKKFITQWMKHTTNIELIAKFADKFITEKAFKSFFAKHGLEIFMFQQNASIGTEIVDILKARVIELAIKQNSEKGFQQLISPSSPANALLHFPKNEKLNTLTSQEKMIIIYMAEQGFKLPANASNAAKSYYKEAIEQAALS